MTNRHAMANVPGMWTYHPELLAAPVPRYTSFPTAAEFNDRVGADEFVRALEGDTREVSPYVHIPFCEQNCWSCGCKPRASNRKGRGAGSPVELRRASLRVAGPRPNADKEARLNCN